MKPIEDYQGYLEARKKEIDQALAIYLSPLQDGFFNTVEEGMHYAVCSGGKRIRPVLLMEGARLAGLNPEIVLPAACSIELLHTYSLVHDDLPAMDNDALRRGKPTCHVQFGEAMAILIGDALLTKAFELLGLLENQEKISVKAVLKVTKMLAQAAGSRGMIGGQEMDLMAETLPAGDVPLKKLQELKTGALLEYALTAGAVLGNMEEKKVKALSLYAKNLGMVFQITDDILDVVGDTVLLGKNIGSDEKNHKVTYVSRYGLKNAYEKAEAYTEEAVSGLTVFSEESSGFLIWLVQSLLYRKK